MYRNLNIKEVCAIANISKELLYKLWRQNEGPSFIKIGRRTLVSEKALNKWLESLQKGNKNEE